MTEFKVSEIVRLRDENAQLRAELAEVRTTYRRIGMRAALQAVLGGEHG